MRQFVLLSIFLSAFSITLTAQERDLPDKALCSVCALRGETEPEKVKAHTEYEGKPYYFCSENCKKEFDVDPVAYLPPKLPRPAPAFVVETLDGRDVSMRDFENKIVLLDFWASWCKPCFEVMPHLQQLYDAHSDDGFVVLGISIDEGEDRLEKINKIVDKLNLSYPIASDAKNPPAWYLYKVKAIPAMFLIDREGQIVAQWTGKIDHENVVQVVTSMVAKSRQNK